MPAKPTEAETLDALLRDVPHIDQYAGTWAIREEYARALADQWTPNALREHIEANQDRRRRRMAESVQLVDGVAIVDVVGPITKYGSSLSAFGGTIELRRQLRDLQANGDVRGIVLRIDSPGGTVAGVDDVAQEIANAKVAVVAYCEDLTASAAYWIASQCDNIVANQAAHIGSIGVYLQAYDFSGYYESKGIKLHVVRSHPLKGVGAGDKITDNQLASLQRIVDGIHDLFQSRVRVGRELSDKQLEAVSTGELWLAAEAKKLGLVDKVGTLEQALDLARPATTAGSREAASASIITPAPGPRPQPSTPARARYTEPTPGSTFIHCTGGPTITEEQPIMSTATPTMSAAQQVKQLVDALVAGGEDRHVAHRQVMRDHPQLRKAFVGEQNARTSRR